MIQIAIIGCGALAELYYAPALQALAGELQVTVLADPASARRQALQRFFPAAKAVASSAEISAGEASLAIVASPAKWHAAQAVELLGRGLHVLCEKPMATTVAEGEAMVQAAQQSGKLLAVGLFRRFFPTSEFIGAAIRDRRWGRLVRFTWAEGGPFNWPAATPSFFQKASSPGGVLADLGVHVLDLLAWWLGEPVQLDYADDAMGGLEANCRLKLRFADGADGTVRLSRDTAVGNCARFEFERGTVQLNGASANEVFLDFGGPLLKSTLGAFDSSAQWQEAHSYPQSFTAQLLNVAAATRGAEALRVPGNESLRSLRLIEECYRQRRLMPMPWLTEAEHSAAAALSGSGKTS